MSSSMTGNLRLTIYLIAIFLLNIASAQNGTTSSQPASNSAMPTSSIQGPLVNVFMPTAFENTVLFAASVIGVCHDRTTYGIRCTSGTVASGFTCGPDFPEATLTEDPSSYIATKITQFEAALVTNTETCSLKGTTEASCSAQITIHGTKQTVTSTTSILTGTDIPTYYMYQIPVTAGVQNLHAAGNACTGAASNVVPSFAAALVGLGVLAVIAIL